MSVEIDRSNIIKYIFKWTIPSLFYLVFDFSITVLV